MEISTGRYKLGNTTDQSGNVSEVNRTFFKDGSGIIEGRALTFGQTHIWPSYRLDNIGASTFKYTAPAMSDWGHMQGNYDFRNGQTTAPSTKVISPIDPAGGYGTISVIAKESSLWHRVKIKLRSTVTGKDNIDENGDISFPTGTKTYKYDDGGVKDKTETIVRNEHYNIEVLPSSLDVGTNTKTTDFIISFKETHSDTETLIPSLDTVDYKLNYEIAANNEVTNKSGKLEIISYYAYDSGTLKEYELNSDKRIVLATWSQIPNILYFASIAWVKKPSSKDEAPQLLTSTEVEYTNTTFELYLFVELGVSPNGGNTIYWNQKYELGGKSLDATMPSDIAKYITIECYNGVSSDGTANDHSKNYNKFTPYTMWQNGNYVKVVGSSLPNNESNNKSRTQEYFADNVTYSQDDIVTINGKKIGAVTSDHTDNKKYVYIDFNVLKYTTTNPWDVKINAILAYDKYNTSTDAKDINER